MSMWNRAMRQTAITLAATTVALLVTVSATRAFSYVYCLQPAQNCTPVNCNPATEAFVCDNGLSYEFYSVSAPTVRLCDTGQSNNCPNPRQVIEYCKTTGYNHDSSGNCGEYVCSRTDSAAGCP